MNIYHYEKTTAMRRIHYEYLFNTTYLKLRNGTSSVVERYYPQYLTEYDFDHQMSTYTMKNILFLTDLNSIDKINMQL